MAALSNPRNTHETEGMRTVGCCLTIPSATPFALSIVTLPPSQETALRSDAADEQIAFGGGEVVQMSFSPSDSSSIQIFFVAGECHFTTGCVADLKLMVLPTAHPPPPTAHRAPPTAHRPPPNHS